MEPEAHLIQKAVKEMYEQFPFPSDPRAFVQYSSEVTELDLCAKESFPTLKDSLILDFGCGTGEIVCGLAKRFPQCRFEALDITETSLARAKKLAQAEGLKNIAFQLGDTRWLTEKNRYDEIISVGVLHATPSAKETFAALIPALKPGGYLTVGLYSAYGRIENRIARFLVRLLAGDRVDRRMRVARRLFGRGVSDVRLADMYAHPQETYHTISEVLSWFKEHDLVYTGSYPPIELPFYPALTSILLRTRNQPLAVRNALRLTYLKSAHAHPLWHHPFFYTMVQLLWISLLGKALFFMRGQKRAS